MAGIDEVVCVHCGLVIVQNDDGWVHLETGFISCLVPSNPNPTHATPATFTKPEIWPDYNAPDVTDDSVRRDERQRMAKRLTDNVDDIIRLGLSPINAIRLCALLITLDDKDPS